MIGAEMNNDELRGILKRALKEEGEPRAPVIPTGCLSTPELAAILETRTSGRAGAHLANCPSCRRRLGISVRAECPAPSNWELLYRGGIRDRFVQEAMQYHLADDQCAACSQLWAYVRKGWLASGGRSAAKLAEVVPGLEAQIATISPRPDMDLILEEKNARLSLHVRSAVRQAAGVKVLVESKLQTWFGQSDSNETLVDLGPVSDWIDGDWGEVFLLAVSLSPSTQPSWVESLAKQLTNYGHSLIDATAAAAAGLVPATAHVRNYSSSKTRGPRLLEAESDNLKAELLWADRPDALWVNVRWAPARTAPAAVISVIRHGAFIWEQVLTLKRQGDDFVSESAEVDLPPRWRESDAPFEFAVFPDWSGFAVKQ